MTKVFQSCLVLAVAAQFVNGQSVRSVCGDDPPLVSIYNHVEVDASKLGGNLERAFRKSEGRAAIVRRKVVDQAIFGDSVADSGDSDLFLYISITVDADAENFQSGEVFVSAASDGRLLTMSRHWIRCEETGSFSILQRARLAFPKSVGSLSESGESLFPNKKLVVKLLPPISSQKNRE